MPTVTKYENGEFSWVDLATTDTDAAKKFYGSLFGWTFEDTPAGQGMTYSMAQLGGQTVAAVYKMAPVTPGAPPFWLPYVTVDDLEARTKKASAAGGKVHQEPVDVMEAGRMSVVEDPAGATLAFWTPKKNICAAMKNEPGTLCWNEVLTSDPDQAGRFYAQTLDWKTKAIDIGPMGTYTLFSREGASDGTSEGGMMALSPDMKGVPSHWLSYFRVTDCDASTKQVAELGGKIVMPSTDIPGMGRYAIVQDPQGATFGLFKLTQ